MRIKPYPKIFLLFCLLIASILPAFSQELSKLLLSQSIEREIRAVKLTLLPSKSARGKPRVDFEQKGRNVSLAALKPSVTKVAPALGRVFIKFDVDGKEKAVSFGEVMR